MTHTLLLMRHAKSDRDAGAPNDFERPLAARGLRDAPRMGAWLAGRGVRPDLVLCSPARRARDTLLLMLAAMPGVPPPIRWEPGIYEAAVPDLCRVLASAPEEDRSVMLVGHNPGLEDLLRFLVSGPLPVEPSGKALPTAAIAAVEISGRWKALRAGRGACVWMVQPGDLDRAPYQR
ncbi:MAG: histidine phosphatase family protein [Gammaproteobacteria bacterium]